MDPEKLMQVAIDAARRGILAGQSPFGCAISDGQRIIAACHNTVLLTCDATAHAEITALREACRREQKILLEDYLVASTCEPCPMCMTALHWARVKRVFYGATIADAAGVGFNELQIPAREMVRQGGSSVELVDGISQESCQELFELWRQQGGKPY